MTFPKLVIGVFVVLFGSIGILYFMKNQNSFPSLQTSTAIEVPIVQDSSINAEIDSPLDDQDSIDRVKLLFTKGNEKLPIVETVTYNSRVSWLRGRPAWIADYASHYNTSRHFIARSLNDKPDYATQKVVLGDKFNVFRRDANIEFHLLVNLSKGKMYFSYVNLDTDEKTLLKVYRVGLGQIDPDSPSGCMTPVGKYKLGSKVGIYSQGVMGYFQNRKVEMMEVFGTRWLPFDKEIEGCSDSAKGYGIHGLPCKYEEQGRRFIEDKELCHQYFTDGSIAMQKEDIEELFSIVITKPTYIEVIRGVVE